MAAGVVTPSCAQVRLTGVGVVVTGTMTLVPQLVAVQVPQFFGLPAESVPGLVVSGSPTETEIPPVPASPEIVNEMPVYAEASIGHPILTGLATVPLLQPHQSPPPEYVPTCPVMCQLPEAVLDVSGYCGAVPEQASGFAGRGDG